MSENLSQRLKRIRKGKRITLEELALRIRLNKAFLSGVEKGKIMPNAEQADVIRAFVGGKL